MNNLKKLQTIEVLSALSQETRLDIFRLLIRKGESGMIMEDIKQTLSLPHSTLSFHLEKLKQANLINTKKEGRTTKHIVNYSIFKDSINFLTKNCCIEDSNKACKINIEDN